MNIFPNNEKWILYVGPFNFPEGGAAAQRIIGICKSLVLQGYKILILSGQHHGNEGVVNYLEPNIAWVAIAERGAENFPKLFKHLAYFNMGSKSRKFLEKFTVKPAAIIIYSGYSPYILQFSTYSKKHKVPVVFDCVEWYQHSNKYLHWLSPYHLNIELAMRHLIPRLDGVISISKYLDDYYKSRGCASIKIPPTRVVGDLPVKSVNYGSPIKLVYTGLPHKKDMLDVLIEAICLANKKKDIFQLTIAGPSSSEVLSYPYFIRNKIMELPPGLVCKGMVAHIDAIKLVENAHFTILLRPKNKVSKAGFSTKLVESMSVGTPLITNLTGDMEDYVIDGKSGVVINGLDVQSVMDSLSRTVDLTEDSYAQMRSAALRIATDNFDFRNYACTLDDFIRSI